jgi:hypothetical protein
MTELSLEDHELIRRYLAGGLTDAEEVMLETRIVEDSRLRSEFELTLALQEGMRHLESRGEIIGLLGRSRDRWRLQSPAIAASLAALVLGLLAIVYFTTRSPPTPPPMTVASLHFERTRGADTDDAVLWTRRSTPTRLQLHFDVGATPAGSYRVVVLRQESGGAQLLSDTVESATADGEVVLSLTDSQLGRGRHDIQLTPRPAADGEGFLTYRLEIHDP